MEEIGRYPASGTDSIPIGIRLLLFVENNIYVFRRIWRIIYRFFTIIPLFALACDYGGQTTSALRGERRDSAGIHITENPAPAPGSRLAWRIGPDPTVSIGTREGDEPYQLYNVRDAMTLPDGRIIVANGGTGELRMFDALGTHLATWGGRGEGPGEFDNLSRIEPWPGDSIAAWFAPGMGISVFNAEGSYARTFTLAAAPGTPPWLRFWPFAATSDGFILSVLTADTVVVQLHDGEGEVRSSLGMHEGSDRSVVNEGTDQESAIGTIFGGTPVWEPWGDLVVITTTSRYELRAFTMDGVLARIVRRGHEPRVPGEAEIEAEIETRPMITRPGSEPTRRPYRASVAEHYPAFASVMSDAVDHMWVREYELPGEARPGSLWTVFDAEGRMLGFVEMPAGLVVHEIGKDYILGKLRDELDIEYVQVWPLGRSGD